MKLDGSGVDEAPETQSRLRDLLTEARRFGPAVFDQGVWSLAGFVASALVGRLLGTEGLGWFALGIALLFGVGGLVNALILDPGAVIGPRDHDDEIRTYGARLLFSAAIVGAVLAVVGVAVLLIGATTGFRVAGVALLVSLPAFLGWTARRLPYLTEQPAIALAGSVAYVTATVLCLFALGALDWLTPVTALAAVGVASAVQAAVGLWAWKPGLSGRLLSRSTWRDLGEKHWSFGRWLLAAEGASWILNYGMAAVSAAVIGLDAAGGFRASQVLLRPYGIVFVGLALAYIPRLSRLLADNDRRAAHRVVVQVGWVLTAIAAAAFLILLFAGSWAMELVFGPEFRPYGWLAAAIAGAMLLHGWIAALSMGLQARDRTRDVFLGQAASALTTLAGSLVLGIWLGLAGFAITFWLATLARLGVVNRLYRTAARE